MAAIGATPGTSSVLVAEAMLEDQIADVWQEHPCLYDVRSPDFKNREMRDNSIQEIAEKIGTTGTLYFYLVFSFHFLNNIVNSPFKNILF